MNAPTFEVFRPFALDTPPADLADAFTTEAQARVQDVTHSVYREIESEALPAPAGATVPSEKLALLGPFPGAGQPMTCLAALT